MRLRTQLSLAGLALLVLPWAGCQYARELESVLRQGQVNAVLATARAVAAALSTRADLLDPQPVAERAEDVYAHRLASDGIQVDGYVGDWEPLQPWIQREQSARGLAGYLAATDGRAFYLMIEVDDAAIHYRKPGTDAPYDHLLLSARGHDHVRVDYQFAPQAPGWVIAERLNLQQQPAGAGTDPSVELPEAPQASDYPLVLEAFREVRLHGVWQERPGGYVLELAMPLELAGPELGFRAVHVGSVTESVPPELGRLIHPSAELGRLVSRFAGGGYRMWVVDAAARVLARAGEIEVTGEDEAGVLPGWIRAAMQSGLEYQERDRPEHTPRLFGGEIRAALGEKPVTAWRLTRQQGSLVLSATLPLEGFFGKLGAVVVEQVDRPVAGFAELALTRLIGLSFLALLAAALVLFGFASVLSLRIQRLHKAAERALTPDGRIRADFPQSKAADELGDLSRSFARLVSGMRESTEYLRSLGSKLSHELRTPLAVVRSSLENLDQEGLSGAAKVYAARAREGADRLGAILSALSEASRMESAIRDAEPESFDVSGVVAACMEGYRDIYPDRRIETQFDAACVRPLFGAPELLAQLLDKLMDNAADFSPSGGWIRCRLGCDSDSFRLSVENQGPLLPEHMRTRLFDSMVSLRPGRGNKLHLGLGLYIARLIAEYHAGRLTGENLPDGEGVRFTAILRDRAFAVGQV